MARPCDCGECRLCWLYDHDERYKALWDNEAIVPKRTVAVSARRDCEHLGRVLDRLGCPCEWKWVRQCAVHGKCTLTDCKTCEEYQGGDDVSST